MPECVIVIPCHNEAARLDVDAVRNFLCTVPGTGIVTVDDGSSDGTRILLEEIAAAFPERCAVVVLPENRGKAEAVRAGVLRALEWKPELVGYWDADLATPFETVELMRSEFLRNPQLELVTGCRLRRLGGEVRRSLMRHLIGRCFATAASLLLRLPVYDTQCGAKLFRGDTAELLFAEPFLTRWLFDVELFFRFEASRGRVAALRRILEFPLPVWRDVGGSQLTLRSAPRILAEFLRLVRSFRRIRRRMICGRSSETIRKRAER